MLKCIFITLMSILFFTACSTKEINSGVDSITSDITNAFEDSRDKSQD